MTEPITRRVKGDHIEMQLALWEGEGKEILCIHGLTANSRCWDRIAEALAPEFQVLALDLRGRGLSDKPDAGYFVDQHVEDVDCLLQDLGVERITLMGHSLGANISLAYAARHPEKVEKLVLMDAAGYLAPSQWDKIEAGIKPSVDRLGQVFPSFEAYTAPLKQAPFLQPWTRFLESYFRYEIEEVKGGVRSRTPAEAIREEIAKIRHFDATRFYSGISCPVLILRATEGILSKDDMVLTEDAAQRMVREMAHAESMDVAGTDHYSILFQANASRDDAIRDFLRES